MTTAPPQQLLQRAVVKATLSGDTVILRGKPRPDGPPAERTLGLAGITAPRFGRRGETEDDPFAFESRNVLRKRLVGKEVFFRVDYAIPGSGREYGVVFVPAEGAPVPNTLESAQMFMIREGLARVREDNRKQAGARKDEVESPSGRGGDIDSLLILESQAKEAKKGIWGDKTEVANRQVLHQLQGEPRDLVDKYAGQKLDAIVEQVRDGSSYRVLLILENESVHQYVNLLPSGIKCPILRSGIPDQEDVVEPYAEEAKFFVETRLLQRDVKVILEGVSGSSNVVGSVLHPKGNIAEFLLSAGLARVQDWSCPLVTGGAAPLREAEKDAKDKKLKIWRNYVAKPTAKGSVGLAGKDFEAIVSRIVSGDTVMVRSETSEEKKVQLSSIRQPKQKTFHNEEAREFLRRRLIGKTVRVTMDYTKPSSDGYEAKDCATIRVGGGPDGGVNIAEAIVERGLASVIRHRRDDDDRSSDYDKLLVAEAKAQKELKGIHSTKEAPPHIEPRDASESAAKAKQLLSFLQRAGRIPAVVEHIANGSRFKVFVPRENAKMTLVFAGIRAPKAARNSSEQSEPYGAEALQYSSRKALQRDVEIEIENVDKTGGFIGSIWLSKTENLAVKLLEEGLATVHEYSASQSTYANQLFAAENLAKAARKNIWANYDEAEENARLQQEETAVAEPTKPNKEYLDVVVSEILDKGGFFVQVVNEGIHSLERLMSEFGLYHTTAAGNPSYRPKNGEVCSAQFTQDDAWYRAKVRRQAPEKGGVEVVYVDYGNSEVVNFSRVRPLPQQFCALPYQSHEATLAYVKVPGQETDYGYEAECRFREMVQGKQLVANVEVRIGGIMHLTLYDPSVSKDPNATLNAQLVADGYATVNRKFGYAKANPGMVNFLGECQQRAKKSRVGMWEYGDITEEEEEVERKPSVWKK